SGKRTEADLADHLKEFDALLAKHKDEKTDDVAQILFMKALLYLEVFDNNEKGRELIQQVKKDFPETSQGKNADKMLAGIDRQEAGKKVQAQLKEGAVFPDFKENDLEGKPLSIANYKGKVVLIDFWATWCGPCVQELPNVLKAYEKYHNKGFDIIGISLDKDKAALTSFIEKRSMPWKQYFDGKGWENKLAQQYGINSIPATYLLDGEGKIVAKDLRGDSLSQELDRLLQNK
ncbi:MAG: TlpA disulfide reductase family protein, partial [Verrucomicrobiota bacterium]